MADVIKENDEDDDIVVVEDKPKGEKVQTQDDDHDDQDDQDDDSRTKSEDDEGDGDEDRESIRERRRQEKKDRRERREAAMRRDKIELDFLRNRNDDLERRMMKVETSTQQAEISNIDAQINAARQRANLAEQVFAKAVAANNGDDAAKAMGYRDQANEMVRQLEGYKHHQQQVMQQAAQQQQQPRQPEQPQMPVAVQRLAQKFMADNDWYDPNGGDEDSAIVMAIDATLTRQGLDPSTEEYWDELRERAAKRLPERFEQKAPRTPKGGPSLGSGREGRNTSGRREVYVSPERKQAMMDAGVWDDPILRARYVKRYEQYDREAKNRR